MTKNFKIGRFLRFLMNNLCKGYLAICLASRGVVVHVYNHVPIIFYFPLYDYYDLIRQHQNE